MIAPIWMSPEETADGLFNQAFVHVDAVIFVRAWIGRYKSTTSIAHSCNNSFVWFTCECLLKVRCTCVHAHQPHKNIWTCPDYGLVSHIIWPPMFCQWLSSLQHLGIEQIAYVDHDGRCSGCSDNKLGKPQSAPRLRMTAKGCKKDNATENGSNSNIWKRPPQFM